MISLRWLLAALLCSAPAAAHMLLLDSGPSSNAPPPSYVGPGDVSANWWNWVGLRGYSGTYAAAHGLAVNIRRLSDSASNDFAIQTNGNIDVGAITAFCSGTTCVATKLYDQSGHGRDAVQSNPSLQPAISLSCPIGLVCLVGPSPSGGKYMTVSATGVTQPIGVSAVTEMNGPVSYDVVFGGTTLDAQMGFANLANTAYLGNAVILATAAANTPHVLTGLINSTHSDLNVDGTDTLGSLGSGGTTGYYLMSSNAGANSMTGFVWEFGISTAALPAAVCKNQQSYYAMTPTC